MKKYRIIIVLIVFAAVLGLISCTNSVDSDRSTTPVKKSICPLAVGNYWLFIDSSFTDTIPTVDTSKVGISESISFKFNNLDYNVFCWNWYTLPGNTPRDYKWLYVNDSSGLWNIGCISASDTLLKTSLKLKYPITVNGDNSWAYYKIEHNSTDNNFILSDSLAMTCKSTNAMYSTPAGTFSCYMYHYERNMYRATRHGGINEDKFIDEEKNNYRGEQTPADIYLYYAPDIGYVGYERKERGTVTFKKVLLKYNIQ